MGKVVFLLIGMLLSIWAMAETKQQIKTHFGTLDIKENKGPKFTVLFKDKELISLDAVSVHTEAAFRFDNKDIILLRFLQGNNSHDDVFIFVALHPDQDPSVSPKIMYPTNALPKVSQQNDTIVFDGGVERNIRTLSIFDGYKLDIVKKGVSNTVMFAQPVPEEDCSKVYNTVYLRAFNLNLCTTTAPMIQKTFANTVAYGAILKRSHVLSMEKLIAESEKTCFTKSVMPYNDFKSAICGYSMTDHPIVDDKVAKK